MSLVSSATQIKRQHIYIISYYSVGGYDCLDTQILLDCNLTVIEIPHKSHLTAILYFINNYNIIVI